MTDRSLPPDDGSRVTRFRPRGSPRWRWPTPRHLGAGNPPGEDLAKYERGESVEDYRHRMKMNLLGLAVTIVLVVAGIWLAERMAEMQGIQDCFISGRRNCAPIQIPQAHQE